MGGWQSGPGHPADQEEGDGIEHDINEGQGNNEDPTKWKTARDD
ncbi:hypothetical protein [Streptomyces sp. URMC 124]